MSIFKRPQCIYNVPKTISRSLNAVLETHDCALSRPHQHQHVSSSQLASLCYGNQLRFYAGVPPRKHPRPGYQRRNDQEDGEDGKRRGGGGIDKRFLTAQDIQRLGKDRLPRDHEIKDPQIMVMENGQVEGPLVTKFVLSKLEPNESLRLIQAYVPADMSSNPPTPARYAMCKIVDKKAEYDRQKQIKEKKKATGGPTKGKSKTLDVSWGIAEHDLATKLNLMKRFLDKGIKVEIEFMPKKRGRVATVEEMEALLVRVRQEADQANARESRKAEGQLGQTMNILFESRGAVAGGGGGGGGGGSNSKSSPAASET